VAKKTVVAAPMTIADMVASENAFGNEAMSAGECPTGHEMAKEQKRGLRENRAELA